jgi:oxygen-independent coproporphyrinogen-3 oxidase
VTRLQQLLSETAYHGYSYAYPHKTAYRPLQPSPPLKDVWAGESRLGLFLYLHVPFCEMRCGFCNLFTQTRPHGDTADLHLEAVCRQAVRVRDALGDARFARFAVGGGTPTYLDLRNLEALFDIAENIMGADLQAIPVSVETSPGTAEADKLDLLRAHGVKRVSIGVQTFNETEAAAVGRPQKTAHVEAALGRIRRAGFPVLNIDLIYGLPGQTVASWLESLRAALRFSPEELYLYPLYARPLTGLGRTRRQWQDVRLDCYRQGRDLLRDAGYRQVTMRMFRAGHAPAEEGPVYCCQEDGMVGLGCGARSYTRELHYASAYAVRARGIGEILADFIARPVTVFDRADHGFRLDAGEQRRRYVIQSLLSGEGLVFAAYRRRFGTAVLDDLPELAELGRHDLAVGTAEGLLLTEAGIERSDTVGPWLFSAPVRGLMESYQCH